MSRRCSRRTSDYNNVNYLIPSALVYLQGNGIVGSSPVTAWNNSGTGGTGYDFDTVAGTGANLTSTTLNGYPAVTTSGSVRMNTGTAVTISDPCTVIFVGQATGSYSTDAWFFDQLTSNRHGVVIRNAAGDVFSIYKGSFLNTAIAEDDATHVFTAQFSTSAPTGVLRIDGTERASGSAGGTNSWGFATLFGLDGGGEDITGTIAIFIVFDRALPVPTLANIERKLGELT